MQRDQQIEDVITRDDLTTTGATPEAENRLLTLRLPNRARALSLPVAPAHESTSAGARLVNGPAAAYARSRLQDYDTGPPVILPPKASQVCDKRHSPPKRPVFPKYGHH